MHRVCSWDVGIKNLAYCIIEKNSIGFKIIKWDIINLIESTNKICSETLKNKNKICGKKASFFSPDDVFYCGMHKKNYEPFENGWENKFMIPCNKLKDNTTHKDKNINEICSYIFPKTQKKCSRIGKFISNNYTNDHNNYYCSAHSKLLITREINEKKLKKIKKIKATNTDRQVLGVNMCLKLDSIDNLLDVDEVLIENQPALKGPSMKSIGSFLFEYCIIRGIIDAQTDKTKVKFISASNKLRAADDDKINYILNKIDKNDSIYKLIIKIITKLYNLNEYAEDDETRLDFVHIIVTYLMNKKKFDMNVKNKLFDKMNMTTSQFVTLVKKLEKDNNYYTITKLLSIKYTESVIDKKWLEYLNKYNKKDDLCDAFLQGYYYIYK
jgi:hypothetical protein